MLLKLNTDIVLLTEKSLVIVMFKVLHQRFPLTFELEWFCCTGNSSATFECKKVLEQQFGCFCSQFISLLDVLLKNCLRFEKKREFCSIIINSVYDQGLLDPVFSLFVQFSYLYRLAFHCDFYYCPEGFRRTGKFFYSTKYVLNCNYYQVSLGP